MSVISAQKFAKFAVHEETEKDVVVTTRPSATSVLAIDSADRYKTFQDELTSFTSPYSFVITRNQSIFNGFFHRIALTEFVFPYYIPNVNAYTNQLYFKKNGGATTTITLTKGFYTPTELAAQVQTLLQASGFASATVVYVKSPTAGAFNNTFYIETNTADTIQFIRGNSTALPFSATSINRFQLFDMMGLTNDDATAVGGARITRARPIEYIDVVCTQLTYNQKLKDASSAPLFRDVLARIYIETETSPMNIINGGAVVDTEDAVPGAYPFTIYRQFKTPKQIMWDNDMPIGSLRFDLYDNYGNPLDAGLAGTGDETNDAMPDWRMTLLISEN